MSKKTKEEYQEIVSYQLDFFHMIYKPREYKLWENIIIHTGCAGFYIYLLYLLFTVL